MREICHGVKIRYAGSGAGQFTEVYVGGSKKYTGSDIQDGIAWAKGYCSCSAATSAMFGLRRKSRRGR